LSKGGHLIIHNQEVAKDAIKIINKFSNTCSRNISEIVAYPKITSVVVIINTHDVIYDELLDHLSKLQDVFVTLLCENEEDIEKDAVVLEKLLNQRYRITTNLHTYAITNYSQLFQELIVSIDIFCIQVLQCSLPSRGVQRLYWKQSTRNIFSFHENPHC